MFFATLQHCIAIVLFRFPDVWVELINLCLCRTPHLPFALKPPISFNFNLHTFNLAMYLEMVQFLNNVFHNSALNFLFICLNSNKNYNVWVKKSRLELPVSIAKALGIFLIEIPSSYKVRWIEEWKDCRNESWISLYNNGSCTRSIHLICGCCKLLENRMTFRMERAAK